MISAQALVKEHFEHIKVEKEKESLREQLAKLRQLGEKHGQYVDQFKSEMGNLNGVIGESDQASSCMVIRRILHCIHGHSANSPLRGS